MRRAGVSSFGVSGTNAHLILEEAPAREPEQEEHEPSPAPPLIPWPVSARSPEALDESLARLASLGEADPLAVAGELVGGRASLPHRAVLIDGEQVARGATERARRVAFVFPGQGSQWQGMGLSLWQEWPLFGEWMERCEQALSEHVEWSLREVLAEEQALEQVDVVQPALWAVMVSLAECWRAAGVEPAAVIGHSQGEIAAAVISGALSLEEGAKVVALRSKAIQSSPARGGWSPSTREPPSLSPAWSASAASPWRRSTAPR